MRSTLLKIIPELTSAGLIDNANIDTDIFGTGKFYKEQTKENRQELYSNIDKIISEQERLKEKKK